MRVQLKLIVTSKRHKTTLLMATAIILNGDDYGMIIRWYTGITNSPVSPNSYVIIPLMMGIWNSVFTNKECGIEYLELGIHTMESRIQDCLWLACMRQLTSYDINYWHLYHFPLTGKCLALACTDCTYPKQCHLQSIEEEYILQWTIWGCMLRPKGVISLYPARGM